ncbi:acyl carrier protein [Dipodascopsis tothii]|uniref:acyl carrier protein n=1 Tax=Dipodascopsis tothii TaxID=44089 RepID=UPI0034CD1B09
MFRASALRLSRAVSTGTRAAFVARPVVRSTAAIRPAAVFLPRFYSAAAGLGREEVEGRIIEIVKSFDKITDASKITPQATFANDLGLDSLDTVEVVMAIEEEFSIEIPDKEADEIKSIGQAIDYILAQSDAV